MSVELIADGIIDLIKKNIIAKTNITEDVSPGDADIYVENAYRFHADEEIVLIDYGYNEAGHIHNNIFEYARIKSVNSTTSITLHDAVQGTWDTADNAFIQKTIGHSPLYDDNVLYGDREVIPVEDMAITVEPVSLGNQWMYIQGGLDEEYRLRIMVYGMSTSVEEGLRILHRYSWAVYSLLNSNIHIDATDIETPLVNDYESGSNTIIIEDTPSNRDNFIITTSHSPYLLQDNLGTTGWYFGISDRDIGGGLIRLTMSRAIDQSFSLSEFAVLRRKGIYVYDSRVDNLQYGQVSKGSALLRASELSWFGNKINRHTFPQTSDGVDDFDEISDNSSSSSSD